jgi:TctA family transporter
MKKFVIPYLPVALILIINVTLWYHQRNSDNLQMLWIMFALVWFNAFFGLFVFKKQPNIYWIYQAMSVLILVLAAVNFYWFSARVW